MEILGFEWMDSFHDQWKLNLFLIGNVLHLTCMFGCMNCTPTQFYMLYSEYNKNNNKDLGFSCLFIYNNKMKNLSALHSV